MSAPEHAGGSGDFSVYRRNGHRYTRMTITLSTVCLLVGGLVRGVWDISEYDHSQVELRNRVTSLEAALRVQGTALETAQRVLASNDDRTVDLKARMAAMEQSLNQANTTLQKLSESQARLEERVIFLVAQVEGRLAAASKGGRQ